MEGQETVLKFPKELAYKPEQGSGHNQGILVLINVISFA